MIDVAPCGVREVLTKLRAKHGLEGAWTPQVAGAVSHGTGSLREGTHLLARVASLGTHGTAGATYLGTRSAEAWPAARDR